MKNRFIYILLALSLIAALGGFSWAEEVLISGYDGLGIMRVDPQTRAIWAWEHENAPRANINPEISRRLSAAQDRGVGTSLSLLSYLQYTPLQRNQGTCGDCWVWAGTGLMEIALNVQNGVKDRLSTQFLNSCKTGTFACCGGSLGDLTTFYTSKGYAVPWSNTNASFQDGTRCCPTDLGCVNGSTAVNCGSISTTPKYSINSIAGQTISTTGVTQATAIQNIKNVINQNKAVEFNFWLVTTADWDAFFSFWNYQSESTIWNPDSYCSHTTDGGEGGHAVLIVGYNDDDANTANHYWTVLNSWGTTAGRPNGLFRMMMYMNYACQNNWYGTWYYDRDFETMNISYNVSPRVRVASADMDNSGTDDITVFRPSSGTWYTRGGSSTQWGTSGDIPVSGRYATPGVTDIAVWRPSDGTWYIKNVGSFPWGTSGDIPVPCDYAGDARTDMAVFRPSTGYWYINAQGSTSSVQWGTSGDIPVPGDYNGDGKCEIAVFRPSEGNWYIRNIGTYNWGTSGDNILGK